MFMKRRLDQSSLMAPLTTAQQTECFTFKMAVSRWKILFQSTYWINCQMNFYVLYLSQGGKWLQVSGPLYASADSVEGADADGPSDRSRRIRTAHYHRLHLRLSSSRLSRKQVTHQRSIGGLFQLFFCTSSQTSRPPLLFLIKSCFPVGGEVRWEEMGERTM